MKRIVKLLASLTVIMLVTTNVFAISLLRPYGFTLPLEEYASNPTGYNNEMYSQLSVHNLSYSDEVLNVTSKGGDAMTAFYFGGKKTNGDDVVVAPTTGRQVSKITFSLSKSEDFFDNKYGSGFETIDCNAFIKVAGNWVTFRVKGYTFKETEYIVKLNWGGPDGGAEKEIPPLQYDEMYTIVFETDIPNHTASMRVEDAEGNILGAKYSNSTDIQAARNGFRFRVRDDFDMKFKEVSSYRESFLVNGLTATDNADTIDISVNMANDCTVRETFYGSAHSAPVLVVGQFDIEDRLLSYTTITPDLPARNATSDSAEYTIVETSAEKAKGFHHAKVCVWSDMEDMLSYCDMVTIGE